MRIRISRKDRHIHDFIPQLEEAFSFQRFGKEVRDVITCSDAWYHDEFVLDSFPNKEMSAINVLKAVLPKARAPPLFLLENV